MLVIECACYSCWIMLIWVSFLTFVCNYLLILFDPVSQLLIRCLLFHLYCVCAGVGILGIGSSQICSHGSWIKMWRVRVVLTYSFNNFSVRGTSQTSLRKPCIVLHTCRHRHLALIPFFLWCINMKNHWVLMKNEKINLGVRESGKITGT